MSLADELLADLEDDTDVPMIPVEQDPEVPVKEIVPVPEEIKTASLDQLVKLFHSERLKNVLSLMEKYQHESNCGQRNIMGPVEADPEYQLIVEANNLAAEIDNEIIVIHRFVRDKYSKRFPELESLVVDPLEYLKTVKEVGNDLAQAKNNEVLQQFLTQATIMVVSVTASTTQGELLTDPELQEIREACDMGIDLNNIKLRIYEYVESRMSFIAPNLSAIIGASTAAKIMDYTNQDIRILFLSSGADVHNDGEMNLAVKKLNAIGRLLVASQQTVQRSYTSLQHCLSCFDLHVVRGVAGGLTNLSKMPACNVLLLGNQKKVLGGFSQVAALPHTGFIYHSSIVQETPPDLRRKAARLVATKCTLAARVDACHESKSGAVGLSLRQEIEKKLDKLQEPPPVKFVKPLPKPIDPPRKKRGGKRVRKMKERYAMTELRKQQNRLNFADIEDDAYQEDLGYTRGTIGKTGTGRIRMAQVDEKTKVRISKTLQKNLQKQQAWGGSSTVRKQVSGTASSVAFTPLQGLEIVNPQAAEKSGIETNKYFSNTAGFVKIQKT